MFIFILYGSEGTKEHLFFLLLSPTHMSLFLLLLQFIVVLLLLPPPFLLLLSSSLPPFTPSFQHLRIWFGAVTVVCPALSLVTWVQSFLRVNSFHFLRPQWRKILCKNPLKSIFNRISFLVDYLLLFFWTCINNLVLPIFSWLLCEHSISFHYVDTMAVTIIKYIALSSTRGFAQSVVWPSL